VNLSGSLPIGVYRAVGGPVVRGAIVVICLPESIALFARSRGYLARGNCAGGVEPLGKPVVAMSGDTVAVGTNGVTVNGRLVPQSRPLNRDSHGRLLTLAGPATVILKTGELYLLATRLPGSYDSRYFGCIPITNVRSVVTR
jgi:conjugative transfer signal peptidase TraF